MGHFDVTVAIHRPLAFVEEGKTLQGQRLKRPAFHLGEHLADLLAGGAVHARVGDRLFPMAQTRVLFFQAAEDAPFQGVLLHIAHARFDLAFVPGRPRPGGQDRHAVVVGKGAELGIKVGIKPVGRFDGRLEVVEDQGPRHAAEADEGVLQTGQERVGGLPINGLAVALARVAEDDAEDVRPPSARGRGERYPAAEVDLGFFSRGALHTAEGQGLRHRNGTSLSVS